MPLKISRILHAGYLFDYKDTQIAFDPIFENPFSVNAHSFPPVSFDVDEIRNLRLAAVFISHFHDDHCSLDSLNLLNRQTPIYLYCIHEELFEIIKELGFKSVYPLTIDKSVMIGSLEVTPRRALDFDTDSLFHVRAGDINILNVVDSWIDDDTIESLANLAHWDLIFWPFQAMREIEVLSPRQIETLPVEIPKEWVSQIKRLAPQFIIPSSCQFLMESWSWYNHTFFPISYKMFQSEIELLVPGTKVVRVEPSQSILIDKNQIQFAPSLGWIAVKSSLQVDYRFDPNAPVPSTSELAKNFNSLSEAQTETVLRYCRNDLLIKYRSMDLSIEPHFQKPVVWCLSLYNHLGQPIVFYYRIVGRQIDILKTTNENILWLTEVPICKLYSAIVLGESLTSLYLRVNDMIFDSKIQRDVQGADILEDPLIRCLYTGVFAGYQKAQLRKLKENRIGKDQ